MLSALIDFSLQNRFLIIALVLLMALGGVYSAVNIPIDAVPDMTNVQVQVVTKAGSLSPLEVERYITYPVETTMNGLPNVQEIRSLSKFGLSLVTIVFREGTDVYRARQLVVERLPNAQERMIHGYGSPQIGVLATALGEVLQFEVKGPGYTTMELRTLLEWEIAPQLRQVPGVIEINSHGGFYKTFQVTVDPDRMATQGVGLAELFSALEQNNASTGGGYIEHYGEQRFIRGQALLKNVADIERVVVRKRPDGVPLLVRDVATVSIEPMVRQGGVTRDGRGEAVTGMVIMLIGENSRTIVHAAKQRLEQIEATLPKGVTLEVIYDRAHLIERTLSTVVRNLIEGGVLVVVILLLTLGSIRAGLVVALAIPLSMLFAVNVMSATGITASLMSLGAIDFGLIVDSSVIMIENCMRRLSHPAEGKSHDEIVRDAAIEVRKPTMFGELIIAVVYVPILALQGMEGKLFKPMALTVLFALAGSLVLSLTLMPVLAAMFLPKQMEEKEPRLIHWFKSLYGPIVQRVVRFPGWTACAALAVFAISVPVALHRGAEFMPRLDEGDILIEVLRLPSATLEDSLTMSTQIEKLIKKMPEVRTVFCRTGRPEIANDVMGVHQTDVWVMLKPIADWPRFKSRDEMLAEMTDLLNSNVPGIKFGFSQPIEMRVKELVAGVKSDVAALLYGDDLEILKKKSKEIEAVIAAIPGAKDVKSESQSNIPTLRVEARPDRLAMYGLDAEEVLNAVSTTGGHEAGQVLEGRARFPIIVRYPKSWRENEQLMEQIPVGDARTRQVPLGEVADVILEESPPMIEHEATRRRTHVACNVRGRDVAGFVAEAQRVIQQKVKLPTGYTIRWGGDFENLQTASLRLTLITPVVLLVIFLLLYTTFKSTKLALLIFLAVPIAASGGIFALWVRGMPFSISAGVGFIALFGVAVLNGLVWVSAAEHLRLTGMDVHAAAAETALVRIRPVLMTALVASFGFLPMALSTTAGAEIQRPLASVVIGGLITSTLLTALAVPAIYPWFVPRGRTAD